LRRILLCCLFASLLGVAAACDDEPTQPPVQVAGFDGSWSFYEAIEDTVWNVGASCEGVGTLVISNANGTFDGVLSLLGARSSCVDGSGTEYPKPGSLDLVDRVITGNQIRFRTSECSYEGWFPGQVRDSIAGTVSCSWTIDVGLAHFAGEWYATK
jgi:hypothetical protein